MIFVPTHLRLLHVSQEPCLLGLSAWKNLTFGRPHAVPDRVRAILRRLEMYRTLDLIEEDLRKDKHHGAHHGAPGHAAAAASPEQQSKEAEGAEESEDEEEDPAEAGGAATSEASSPPG